MTAVPGIATELHVFSAGQAAKAQEVNDNFQRLDTAIQNRATKASLESTDGALKGVQATVGALQTGKAEKSDLDALSAKQKTDSTALAKATVDSANAIRNSFPTLSLPQDLAPTSSPTFAGAVVKGSISGYHARFGGGVSSSPNVFIDAGEGYTSQLSHAVAGVTRWTEQLYLADTYRWVARDATGATVDFPLSMSTLSGGEMTWGGSTHRKNRFLSDVRIDGTLAMGSTWIVDPSRNASFASVAVHSPANTLRQIALNSDVASRWALRSDGTEPNDYIELRAYNDAGIYQDAPWAVARSAGSPFVIKRPLRLMVGYGVGILHSSSNGTLTSSAIVNDDLGSLGDTGKIVKFGAKGLAVATSDDLAAMGVVLASGGTITGDLRITGKLTTPPGATPADYVFEPDYKLAPLSEVEAFTKANKHLPEVPSAKEMTENGVDMAAMNMVLLKKVEELTLHAIALQKDVEAQKTALADQQKVMADMKAALEAMRGR